MIADQDDEVEKDADPTRGEGNTEDDTACHNFDRGSQIKDERNTRTTKKSDNGGLFLTDVYFPDPSDYKNNLNTVYKLLAFSSINIQKEIKKQNGYEIQ